jgi:hypothetical protein
MEMSSLNFASVNIVYDWFLPVSLVVHGHNVHKDRVALVRTQAREADTQGGEHSPRKDRLLS